MNFRLTFALVTLLSTPGWAAEQIRNCRIKPFHSEPSLIVRTAEGLSVRGSVTNSFTGKTENCDAAFGKVAVLLWCPIEGLDYAYREYFIELADARGAAEKFTTYESRLVKDAMERVLTGEGICQPWP